MITSAQSTSVVQRSKRLQAQLCVGWVLLVGWLEMHKTSGVSAQIIAPGWQAAGRVAEHQPLKQLISWGAGIGDPTLVVLRGTEGYLGTYRQL